MWDRWVCVIVCGWVAMATVKTVHGRCGGNGRYYMVKDGANDTQYTLHIWGMTLPQECPWLHVFDETTCECRVDPAVVARMVLEARDAGIGAERTGEADQFGFFFGKKRKRSHGRSHGRSHRGSHGRSHRGSHGRSHGGGYGKSQIIAAGIDAFGRMFGRNNGRTDYQDNGDYSGGDYS